MALQCNELCWYLKAVIAGASKMPTSPHSVAIVIPSQRSVQVRPLEAHWYLTSAESGSRAESEANHSAPIDTYDSTPGVCNELARIAMNRSAVMQAYDSMFPRSGVLRAADRRRSSVRDPSRPGWVQRTLDLMFGRTAG